MRLTISLASVALPLLSIAAVAEEAPRFQLIAMQQFEPATPPAKVEIDETNIIPLSPGEKVWSDRTVTITKVPARFKGFNFTQHHAHGLSLTFKVLNDGVVYLGCSARWGTTADPDVARDFETAKTLTAKGWVRKDRFDVDTTAHDMQFEIFERPCKAGETFTIRTDKYAPPILLVK